MPVSCRSSEGGGSREAGSLFSSSGWVKGINYQKSQPRLCFKEKEGTTQKMHKQGREGDILGRGLGWLWFPTPEKTNTRYRLVDCIVERRYWDITLRPKRKKDSLSQWGSEGPHSVKSRGRFSNEFLLGGRRTLLCTSLSSTRRERGVTVGG